jgi:hypothetical protein
MCFFICIFLCFISLNHFLLILCFSSLIFVKLAYRIIILHASYIASYGKFPLWFMSNDPKKFIFKSLSRNISSWKERGWSDCPWQWAGLSGRTRWNVRRCGADRPRGSGELGEVLDAPKVISDRLRQGVGPSARLADCPRVCHGMSARAVRRWGQSCEWLSQQAVLLLP